MAGKVTDLRTSPGYLVPEEDWIPQGHSNTIVDICMPPSRKPIGSLETGTDGFIQAILRLTLADGSKWSLHLTHRPNPDGRPATCYLHREVSE
jgi:hypothetical protein